MDKLRAYLNDLTVDEQEKFAIRCGTTIGYLRKAISTSAVFGAGLAVRIERESNKAVIVEDLLPDVDWKEIRRTQKVAA